MFEFAYPWVLSGLLLLPLLYGYLVFWKPRPSLVVSSVNTFRSVVHKRRVTLVQLCMLGAAAVLIVALARPRFGDEKVVIRARGIDIILALDMSGSMQAIDVPEGRTAQDLPHLISSGAVTTRLEVAKREIRRFIEARPNDRIGLLGFADLAYSFAPPTLDHAWLIDRLEQLKPGQIGDATGIASPIGSATSRLKNSAAPRRVLVLFTDGANTAENRVTPEQAAQLAGEFSVILHTVGIGSGNAYVLDTAFNRLIPAPGNFDEKLLSSLAQLTGGSYFHAADADGLHRVMQEINKLEKTTVEQPRYVEFREQAPPLALLALILMLTGFLLNCSYKLQLP